MFFMKLPLIMNVYLFLERMKFYTLCVYFSSNASSSYSGPKDTIVYTRTFENRYLKHILYAVFFPNIPYILTLKLTV